MIVKKAEQHLIFELKRIDLKKQKIADVYTAKGDKLAWEEV